MPGEMGGPKLTTEIIQAYTQDEIDAQVTQYTAELYDKLMPEWNLELSIYQTQKKQQQRIRADIEIANRAAELVYRIKGGEFERALSCFAVNTPGVSAEFSALGVYEGKEKLQEYFLEYLPKLAGQAGTFQYINLCSPVIEVAQDGKTGRGMWLSVGMQALKRPDLIGSYTDPVSLWAMNTWCMDFVQENGVWKIWHLYVLEEVETTYEESWTESAGHKLPVDPAAPKPTRPSQRHTPFTAQRKPVLHAEPPVPYDTYDETTKF